MFHVEHFFVANMRAKYKFFFITLSLQNIKYYKTVKIYDIILLRKFLMAS